MASNSATGSAAGSARESTEGEGWTTSSFRGGSGTNSAGVWLGVTGSLGSVVGTGGGGATVEVPISGGTGLAASANRVLISVIAVSYSGNRGSPMAAVNSSHRMRSAATSGHGSTSSPCASAVSWN
ncbi:MAG: hypothetical protein HY595_04225 [Candidatus Omnitrophica bacterium]|nr:hypothetical protein [Candidatus Omnitrophota bacterium]